MRQYDGRSSFQGADGGAHAAAGSRGRAGAILTATGLLLVVAALIVAAYPFALAKWSAYWANRQFTAERAMARQYDQADVDAAIAAAESYNAYLAGMTNGADVAPYERQLACEDSHAICWLDIPALDVKLPVFRDDGTDEVPAEGAEHVLGTSLPVGGMPSNTVITAHSGSHEGASMAFNKLDFLEVGDTVILWTLGRPFAYEVTGWEQVDSCDTSRLVVDEATDELTLLTCRPIGTTARRLFVHASRVEYLPQMENVERVEILAEPDLLRFVAVLALCALLVWALLLFGLRRRRRQNASRDNQVAEVWK